MVYRVGSRCFDFGSGSWVGDRGLERMLLGCFEVSLMGYTGGGYTREVELAYCCCCRYGGRFQSSIERLMLKSLISDRSCEGEHSGHEKYLEMQGQSSVLVGS